METITVEELQHALAEDVVVLEALPPNYFQEGHLPGASNLPLDALEPLAPRRIPTKQTPVVTYCSNEQCSNSSLAAERLRELGYTNVRKFPGGKQAWVEAGLPLEQGASNVEAAVKGD